jgi:tetratricopeptide (TPR) repeat protein
MVKAMIPVRLDENCLAFSPDGSRLALVKGWQLKVVDLQRDEICFQWQGSGYEALSWSPDGRFLACAGPGDVSDGGWLQWTGWVQVFDLEKRQRLWKLRPGTHRVDATAVTWSPDGRRLVSGDVNGLAVIWEATTGQKVTSVQLHTAAIKALAWSPDGRRIASGGEDQAVLIWDANGGEELLRFDVPTGVTHLQWSADGRRLAAACKDGTIQIWDASIGYQFVNSEADYADQLIAQNNKAVELWNSNRHDEAIALLEQSLKDSKAKLGPDHDITLRIMARLGDCYYEIAGRMQDSLKLREQQLALCKSKLGPNHRWTLLAINDLAGNYHKLGRYIDAVKLLQESIRVAKANNPDESVTFNYMNNLAESYKALGRHEDALKLKEERLGLLKTKLGPDHLDTCKSVLQLAGDYYRLGRYTDALNLYQEALKLAKARFVPNHRVTVWSMYHVARSYSNLGRYTDAVKLYQETLLLLKANIVSDSIRLPIPDDTLRSECMNNLAWLLATCPDLKLRDPGQAVAHAKKAVELAPDNRPAWNTLGAAQYRNGDWKAAIEALMKSVQLRKEGDSFDFFFLAMAHWRLNDKDKARDWYHRAVAWMDKNNPQNEELKRFHVEAAALLGLAKTAPTQKKKD